MIKKKSNCGRVAAVEVKKRKTAIGSKIVEDFHEKVNAYATLFPEKTILPALLSPGGFTGDAAEYCKEKDIGTAEKIEHF